MAHRKGSQLDAKAVDLKYYGYGEVEVASCHESQGTGEMHTDPCKMEACFDISHGQQNHLVVVAYHV